MKTKQTLIGMVAGIIFWGLFALLLAAF